MNRRWNRQGRGTVAFTLIEMVGVLALMALVAGVLTPSVARRLSRSRGEKEEALLASLGSGLIQVVHVAQRIPGPSTWVAEVAGQIGLAPDEVRYVGSSEEGNLRVFLVHPDFTPSDSPTSDPIWTQVVSGSPQVQNARILLLSSHKPSLVIPLASGRASSAAAFDALWDWTLNEATGDPPEGWPASWAGNGEYLHVHRLNLQSEFHRLTYSNVDFPSAYPDAEIGGGARMTLDSVAAMDAWFLQGTRLRFYRDAASGGELDLSHTVVGSVNFLYADHHWTIP